MPIVVGLILLPVVAAIIYRANLLNTRKIERVALNLLLPVTAVLFFIFCGIVKEEPFTFEEHYSLTYMIMRGEYILEFAVIFVFTPFMWVELVYFIRKLLRALRVRKNAVIRRSGDYIYYREDLDKVSPSLILFASTYEVDIRKSISATILKLKLSGYIEEKNGGYVCRDKGEAGLPASEKMVFNLIRGGSFDKNEYRKAVEEETLKNRYLTKNRGGVPFRIVKMILAVCMPVLLFAFVFRVDDYVMENYMVYPDPNGYTYIRMELDRDIEQTYEEVRDIDDYYHSTMYDGSESYNYRMIRADKLEYSVVRKTLLLNVCGTLTIWIAVASVLVAAYIVLEQAVHFRRNYRRTLKGKSLLNKAYALKNYLKDYSLIKDRTEEELVLWEYYLVYAVALGVNEKIQDKLIDKYVRSIV